MTPGFVYLVAGNEGLTKIGRTADLKTRLEHLRRETPGAALLHQIRTDDSVWLEGFLHGWFASVRAGGEWFLLSAEDITALCTVQEWRRGEDPPCVLSPASVLPRKTTIKVDAELLRKAKAIASIRGIDLYDLIDGLLRQPIEDEYTRRVREG